MSFLNRTNFDHVFGLALQYLKDTNMLFVTEKELYKLIADTMTQIQATKDRDKEELDVEKWNKQTILAVRDIVKQRAPQGQQAPQALQTQPQEAEAVGDPFFMKLQELETVRKSGNVWLEASTPAATAPVATPTPPTPVASTTPSVTTIYMQAPPEKGSAIHLRSWHRSWIQSPLRAAFTWQGPLPTSVDVNSVFVTTVIVPKNTLQWTPYVILEMEGAGGQVNECILVPSGSSGAAPWEYLQPGTRSMGHVRPLALPWKIRLLDADRELLPLGKDHWKVQSIQHINNLSRITVGAPTSTTAFLNKDFCTHEWLMITHNSLEMEVRCKVVAVGPNTIDVDEKIDMKMIGGDILHLHRQSCVILETKK